ncbi:MAG TPA: hypothetical protein DCX54_06955 [Flavobacteriales bacterium]|nr:hypothetical protein [Flavobacteriales bacterium]
MALPGSGSRPVFLVGCWDNAPVESFFGSLKPVLVFQQNYLIRFHARQSIFEYIE